MQFLPMLSVSLGRRSEQRLNLPTLKRLPFNLRKADWTSSVDKHCVAMLIKRLIAGFGKP